MKLEKKWYEYIYFVIYTFFIASYFVITCYDYLKCLGFEQWLIIMIIILVQFLLALFIIGIHKLLETSCRKNKNFFIKGNSLEACLVIVIIIIGLILRFYYMESSNYELFGQVNLYEQAIVTNFEKTAQNTYGLAAIYNKLLTAACSILGNKPIAAIALHCVLQQVIAFFLYVSVKKLVGVGCSILALSFFCLMPIMVESVSTIDVQIVSITLFFIVLYFVYKFLHQKHYPERSNPLWLLSNVLLGLITCILCSMNMTYFLLVFVYCYYLFSGESNQDCLILKKGYQFLSFGFGFLGTVLILLWVTPNYIHQTIVAYYKQQWLALQSISFQQDMPLLGVYFEDTLLLLAFAMIGIVLFFINKNNCFFPWSFCFIIYIVAVMLGLVENNNLLIGSMLAFLMAGSNVELHYMKDQKILEIVLEKEPEPEQNMIIECEPEPEQSIHFIHNPLPVPKKHVKKEFVYPIDVSEEFMKFDIELKENDDFDIK